MKTIHVLRHGWPLCMFTERLPCDWPWGHVWVSELDVASAGEGLCEECSREHERIKAAASAMRSAHVGAN